MDDFLHHNINYRRKFSQTKKISGIQSRYDRSALLSTNYDLKCPDSKSNENLFSWGHVRPNNFFFCLAIHIFVFQHL